jgi:Na+-driven multidrug efflux pump
MHSPAKLFLSLRALGAPAVVVSLAIQGIFRGLKDTKTPLLYSGLGNISAVLLLPFLVYSLNLGLNGAALATIASQYVLHLNIFKQFHPDVPQFQEHTNCFIV